MSGPEGGGCYRLVSSSSQHPLNEIYVVEMDLVNHDMETSEGGAVKTVETAS